MKEMYQNNRIYITPDEQLKIKRARILIAGASLGSVIAECALRLGFETITLIDENKVEISDLNRQNYERVDIGQYKVDALKRRLEAINPMAKITAIHQHIDCNNADSLIPQHDIAINSLQFNSDIPFVFDRICKKYNIPVIHPHNIGWAGLVTVVEPTGKQLCDFNDNWQGFDITFIKHIANYYRYWGGPKLWIENAITHFDCENRDLPLSQLSVASWIVGGLVTNLLFDITIGNEFKKYPQFYLSTAKD